MSKKKLFKNEYVETIVMIVVIVAVVLGVWYGSQFVLGSQYPALAVASGSMCVRQGPSRCDGWSHPFDRTLHLGDLIIVQGVNPNDIHPGQKYVGDIIVYRALGTNTLIVHRVINKTVDGTGNIFFITQGDANPGPDQPVASSQVIGRVVMRIPWIGHLALFMRNSSGLYVIIAIIILLVIVEFLIPEYRDKKKMGSRVEPPAPSTD